MDWVPVSWSPPEVSEQIQKKKKTQESNFNKQQFAALLQSKI